MALTIGRIQYFNFMRTLCLCKTEFENLQLFCWIKNKYKIDMDIPVTKH